MVAFLCGCQYEPAYISTVDTEGFVVCPKHNGIRRYGWRSRFKIPMGVAVGSKEYIMAINHSMSLQDYEKYFWLRYGIEITEVDGSYRILRRLPQDANGDG